MWALIVMLFAVPAVACDPGCTEYYGNCACDQKPEQAVQTTQPSDERPPRSAGHPWENPDIIADMPKASTVTWTAPDDLGKAILNSGVPIK